MSKDPKLIMLIKTYKAKCCIDRPLKAYEPNGGNYLINTFMLREGNMVIAKGKCAHCSKIPRHVIKTDKHMGIVCRK